MDSFWTIRYVDNRGSKGGRLYPEDHPALGLCVIARNTISWNGIDCMRNRRYFSYGASRPLRRLTVHFDSVPAVDARRHANSDRSHAYLLPERVYPDAGRQSA
jgi:hypothetical protein